MIITDLRLASTLDVGAALYCIVPEHDLHVNTFLLGLGLWDRANSPHTQGVKDATKGQILRIDESHDLMSASEELSNIVYQIAPLDDGRIFVGCRNGDLMYLNKDLSLDRKIDLPNRGLYFFVREGSNLIATMREGSLLFYDLISGKSEILPIVDSNIRMWPIHKDGDRILAGSYKGHLAEIIGRELVSVRQLSDSRAAIWTIDKFNGDYLVGTANGDLFALDENLSIKGKVLECDTGITYMTHANGALAIGNVHGDIHILNPDYSMVKYEHVLDEKISNTIWSIACDESKNLLRVGHSNGQMRTFVMR